jgi:hypothetical protein
VGPEDPPAEDPGAQEYPHAEGAGHGLGLGRSGGGAGAVVVADRMAGGRWRSGFRRAPAPAGPPAGTGGSCPPGDPHAPGNSGRRHHREPSAGGPGPTRADGKTGCVAGSAFFASAGWPSLLARGTLSA